MVGTVVGTALVATLTDDDTVSGNPTWEWERSKRPDTGFTEISGEITASYAPSSTPSNDHAYFLRATVEYTDGDGAGKTATATTRLPVGVPRRTLLTAEEPNINTGNSINSIMYKSFVTGDNPSGYQLDRISVHLKENVGDPVTAQLYRRGQTETAGVGSFFVDLAPEDPSADLNSDGVHWLVPPPGTVLEPDTTYFIRLTGVTDMYFSIISADILVAGAPFGSASGWRLPVETRFHHPDDTFRTELNNPLSIVVEGVELLGPPNPPQLGADGRENGVTLQWRVQGASGHRATSKFQSRYKKTSEADSEYSLWADVEDRDSDMDLSDERSVTISGLEGYMEYTFQLRAVNIEGEGTPREVIETTGSAPAFPADTARRPVTENATSGDLGLPITANDADGVRAPLTYSVAATTDADGGVHLDAFNRDFSLNTSTGQISVKATAMIDYETLAAYTVLYQVADGANELLRFETGTPAVDDTLTLTIDVDDVELESFLTINDVTMNEPVRDAGTATATFTVRVSPALPAGSSPATVSWQTGVGSDTAVHWATAGTDFTASSGTQTLTFNAGETSKTITVDVLGDSLDEWDEQFLVTLAAPQAPLGFIADGTVTELSGTATILDSDMPIASITSTSEALEGESAELEISLDIASSRDLAVEYTTPIRSINTAGDMDYTEIQFGTNVLVPAGSTSAMVEVQTTDDAIAEVDEQFLVVLEVNGVILHSSDPNAMRVQVGDKSAAGNRRQ